MDKDSKKAVALRYKNQEDNAPKVVAKGRGFLADKIEKTAKKHSIYIEKDPLLAESLYKVKLNEEIPEELYEAVAKILAYIYSF
ncbi:EscU/YscU/HrcU family type III secretion system export apparatus switch protein [Hippea maritima]|uniref:Type III secretion exporter n=1 Tax=Hippea maritima (strain ATCC 700847 / DSM 10411 / MH2) TaxID=760142 RepID=F2LV11_HIPMA|nr:EscU/YscU/HrcU family type III secretion system export apparatus switch protein [Hippea maritima]AEA33595.1 type III secretion exporter [Hippea maritima DSM 10411]